MTLDFDALAHEHVAAFLAGRAVDQALFDAVCWSVSARLRDQVQPALDALLRMVLLTGTPKVSDEASQ